MSNDKNMQYVEKEPNAISGMLVLVLHTLLVIAAIIAFIFGIILLSGRGGKAAGILLTIIGGIYGLLFSSVPYLGLKIVKPNEAYVFTLFGKYYGTIKREGFYFVNPFVTAVNPSAGNSSATTAAYEQAQTVSIKGLEINPQIFVNKKVSLKVTTLNNDKQKINDQLGNPIIIGIVVVWKIMNPTKAVFNVDNYKEFLSIQCDSALRNIVRLYPYDTYGDDNEKTLRGSSQEVALKLLDEIQAKVEIAGIDVMEARITSLSYAPEIAAAMLQRQQASAIIDARQMIVEGAVGMVELALSKLSAKNIVTLDDERKAAMVSNLMVVLCGNKDATPVINSGTLY
jgi:regulator of protease activity HflC (stomatin/prohibitin superfamily)